jgi:hypothetical protein
MNRHSGRQRGRSVGVAHALGARGLVKSVDEALLQ